MIRSPEGYFWTYLHMEKDNIPTLTLISTPICILSFDEQIDLMITWAKNCQSKIVCVANVHMLIEAWQDANFASILKQANLVTPDGLPLVWMLKSIGSNSSERVAGLDIFLAICDRAAQAQISIFLLGSKPEILEKICHRLKQEFPLLKIAGMEAPPFAPLETSPDMKMVHTINTSGAGIVFVALGCPKQELWMAQHREQIQSVKIGIGGVFSVYAGELKQTPKFIQKTGFEWLFRLIQEPRRLWKRYIYTIPVFIWLALKQILTRKAI
jgi:N-acetylglucosaminyldiphosphoundecaprenol N-acetyl-beta-D-mannosaminyltransferase